MFARRPPRVFQRWMATDFPDKAILVLSTEEVKIVTEGLQISDKKAMEGLTGRGIRMFAYELSNSTRISGEKRNPANVRVLVRFSDGRLLVPGAVPDVRSEDIRPAGLGQLSPRRLHQPPSAAQHFTGPSGHVSPLHEGLVG